MSKQKHTPEPWALHESESTSAFGIYHGKKYIPIGTCQSRVSYLPEDKANAARIVACVNACEGMGDPQSTIDNMRQELQRFRNGAKDIERIEDKHLRLAIAALESIAEIRPVNKGGREACFALAVKRAQTALYELEKGGSNG
jgi:hypothetical protein